MVRSNTLVQPARAVSAWFKHVDRFAFGFLTVLGCLGASEVRADCNLSKVQVTNLWKENYAELPNYHIFVGKMYYEISNFGQDGCDLSLEYHIDDQDTPPMRYALATAFGQSFINAGEKVITWVEWNFDSRNYPEESGARWAVLSIVANGRQYIMRNTNSSFGADDWPGSP